MAVGTYAEIVASPRSLTGKYLSGELSIAVPATRVSPDSRALVLKGLKANNLKGLTVSIPIGLITCVTGVSGSGKSTLVVDTLYKTLARRLYDSKARAGELSSISGLEFIDKVIDIDQSRPHTPASSHR